MSAAATAAITPGCWHSSEHKRSNRPLVLIIPKATKKDCTGRNAPRLNPARVLKVHLPARDAPSLLDTLKAAEILHYPGQLWKETEVVQETAQPTIHDHSSTPRQQQRAHLCRCRQAAALVRDRPQERHVASQRRRHIGAPLLRTAGHPMDAGPRRPGHLRVEVVGGMRCDMRTWWQPFRRNVLRQLSCRRALHHFTSGHKHSRILLTIAARDLNPRMPCLYRHSHASLNRCFGLPAWAAMKRPASRAPLSCG